MPRAVVAWIVVTVAAGSAYLLAPISPDGLVVVYTAWTLACAAVVCTSGARRPKGSLPWWLIAGGLLLSASGDAIWAASGEGRQLSSPSVVDVCYLSAYLAFAGALFVLARRPAPARDWTTFLDAAIVVVGSGALAWSVIIAPQVDSAAGAFATLVGVAYPVCDLLLLGLLVWLAFVVRGRWPATRLLGLGILVPFVWDTVYAIPAATAGHQTGEPADLGWMAAYGLMAAAALHPSSRDNPERPARLASLPVTRLGILAATTLLLPTTIILGGVRDGSTHTVVLGGLSAALFALVLFRIAALVRQVEGQAAELERISTTDQLTEALNRRAWNRRLEREVRRAQRAKTPVAVVLLDLDQLRKLNDAHGYQRGDLQLRQTAQTWQETLRPGDVLARYEEDTFALLLPGADGNVVPAVLDRLLARVPNGQSSSAGVALVVAEETADEVVARAESALRRAKATGRARWCMAPQPMHSAGALTSTTYGARVPAQAGSEPDRTGLESGRRLRELER